MSKLGVCQDPSKIESHPGMMWSGEPTFRDVMPSPTAAGELQMCCELAAGVVRSEKFSFFKYSNHSTHQGQPAYLCAAYGDDAKLVTGNSSITASQASGLPPPAPAPPKPDCNFATAQECICGGGATNCREDLFRQLTGGVGRGAGACSPKLASRNDALMAWQDTVRGLPVRPLATVASSTSLSIRVTITSGQRRLTRSEPWRPDAAD